MEALIVMAGSVSFFLAAIAIFIQAYKTKDWAGAALGFLTLAVAFLFLGVILS